MLFLGEDILPQRRSGSRMTGTGMPFQGERELVGLVPGVLPPSTMAEPFGLQQKEPERMCKLQG